MPRLARFAVGLAALLFKASGVKGFFRGGFKVLDDRGGLAWRFAEVNPQGLIKDHPADPPGEPAGVRQVPVEIVLDRVTG